MDNWGNLEGLIPMAGGVLGYLMAAGKYPRHPKDPAKMEAWRKKYGKMMRVLSPLLFLFGVAELLGLLH